MDQRRRILVVDDEAAITSALVVLFEQAGYEVWPAQRRVMLSEETVELTPKEYDLLCYFMTRPGRAIGRETLLRQVWGYDGPVDSRTVDTHIRRLRAKLEADPAAPELFQTVHGFGYRLAEPDGS